MAVPSFRKASIPNRALSRQFTTSGEASSARRSMPPGFTAKLGHLATFVLPETVRGSRDDQELGKAMVKAFRRDGIFQIAMTDEQRLVYTRAMAASRQYFRMSHRDKAACVDALSYSGYIASGEEITDGIADYSEIFTVTKDISQSDPRVARGWPCHGPCPWPNFRMQSQVQPYVEDLSNAGESLLLLLELGLGVPESSLTKYTRDGWHHLRMLRFPPNNRTNGKGKKGRGIGSHTDYGLLVIAAQDNIGGQSTPYLQERWLMLQGLFIRPPARSESFANWKESSAGLLEDHAIWVYVPPVPGVFTVFPGDMLQYMTNSRLVATPHKVGLNTCERFAFAYFHEPRFETVVRPLPGHNNGQEPVNGIHYGTHFTNMSVRNYPHRITTKRLLESGWYTMLQSDELREEVDQ